MNEIFHDRAVKKTYRCIVEGTPSSNKGHLVHWLRQDPVKNFTKAFESKVSNAAEAKLSYEVLKQGKGKCLLEINLETGRNPRYELTKNLNQNLNYYFVLVHHENKNIIDYTEKFGYEYKMLLHVITRLQTTQEVVNYIIPNMRYPLSFPDASSASMFLNTNTCTEGIIVKRLDLTTNKTFLCKIHSDNYWIEKEKNPNYPNNWLCYLDIYKNIYE
jgi:hypothetical protein